MSTIKLQSSDGIDFQVDVQVAKCFGTVKTMLEDCGMDQDNEEEGAIIPLRNVNADILRLVLRWAEHHKDDPTPTDDNNKDNEKRTKYTSKWDADFLTVDQSTLFQLISAANFLDIKGLMDIACDEVANMIKGKSPDEINKTFNIKNDLHQKDENPPSVEI